MPRGEQIAKPAEWDNDAVGFFSTMTSKGGVRWSDQSERPDM